VTAIGIIGTGGMARELGKGWIRAGHDVTYGSRTPGSAPDGSGLPVAAVTDYRSAIESADVVVIAIPYPAVVPFIDEHRESLTGRIIVDITNPFDNLAHNEKAGVEYTSDALGTTDGVVAAFKDNFVATINTPGVASGQRADVKIAADDARAKDIVRGLAEDLDHRALDCGPLHNARLIDSMVSLMLVLDREYAGFTRKTGWKFVGLDDEAPGASRPTGAVGKI
jgi:predicted dinucleotide-binding enzyme